MWQPQSFYNKYILRSPVILSGSNSIRGLYNYPAAKIAVIHGKSFNNDDIDLFSQTFSKREIKFFVRSWAGEPDFAGLSGTVHELEEFRPDLIIAVGGGSVIDGAKLCRLFYELPGFEAGKTRLESCSFRTNFIAVPGALSGAEISSAAVYLENVEYNHTRKNFVVCHDFIPDVIIYDELYLTRLPDKLLCSSGLDALSHILEGCVSLNSNSFLDSTAEKSCEILINELAKIYDNISGINYERLLYAGFTGGLIQNHCIVGAAHALAHQLTQYNYSHSEAVSLLLPSVIEKNSHDNKVKAKYESIAGISISQIQEFIRNICNRSGISRRRSELKSLLETLSCDKTFCDNVRLDRGGRGNPLEITDDYMQALIRRI